MMTEEPQAIYDRIVNVADIRRHREEVGCGIFDAKRYHQRKALLKILSASQCDPEIRFILKWLIEDLH